MQGYEIFEKTRTGLVGLLTAINGNLSPVLISSGSEKIEILVVQIMVGKQNDVKGKENDVKGKILAFWQEFEKEVINAREENCFVLVEMYANAKLGGQIIENDPHNISDNGIILSDIIRRQNLTCVNATKLCEGPLPSTVRHYVGMKRRL